MNNKILILNEFEENENIEEVFYDLDGMVIEDILSIKKDDGTLPLQEIFKVSELIDTVKSEGVLLCKKISKAKCETIAYMRKVTWHKNPYYYNWDFYSYNLECNAEDAFLIPEQERIVFGAFTGHKLDDSPKIRKYIEQITASNSETFGAKTKKLLQMFPFLTKEQIIRENNKQTVYGDILIDDGVHNLIGGTYKKFLFNQPNNSGFNEQDYDITRVYSWKDIYERISNFVA